MRPTLHAIIRSRVTPWVLLVLSITTGTLVALRLRPKPAASPQLQELSERVRGRGREYVRGLELIVGGDAVMGDDLLASATDRMAVLADECVRLPGCDAETFMAALAAAIDERRLALREARRAPGPTASVPPSSNDAVDQPTGVAPASASETVPPRQRLNLEEAITLNGPVKRALSDWLTWNRPQLADAYENYLFLRGEIAPIYDKAGLPEALLFAVMAQETGAKVHAYSSAGAVGPLQFMPTTARRYGLDRVGGFDMRLDPVASTRASAVYLTTLLDRFGNDLPKALAAYNAGETRLATLHRQLAGASFWDAKVTDAMPAETRSYVPAVLAAAWMFLHADEYGLVPTGLEVGTTTIALRQPLSLGELTICLGADNNRGGWFRTLRNLNPRLSGSERIDAGEKVRMPSMLVPLYVDRCAGDSPLLAHARDLHDGKDDAAGRFDYALQDGDT